jgi:hypothetical protein
MSFHAWVLPSPYGNCEGDHIMCRKALNSGELKVRAFPVGLLPQKQPSKTGLKSGESDLGWGPSGSHFSPFSS